MTLPYIIRNRHNREEYATGVIDVEKNTFDGFNFAYCIDDARTDVKNRARVIDEKSFADNSEEFIKLILTHYRLTDLPYQPVESNPRLVATNAITHLCEYWSTTPDRIQYFTVSSTGSKLFDWPED